MTFTKVVPNMVSLTRIPLGGLALMFCAQDQWLAAFCCMIAGFATDGLDGYLALKLKAKSDEGAMIDSISDFTLGAGVYFGLLVSNAVSREGMITLAVYALATWLPVGLGRKTSRVRIFFEGFNSFVAVIAGCAAILVFLWKINEPLIWLITIGAGVCVGFFLVLFKRQRLIFWWLQITGKETKSQF